jgi:cell division protein FtsI/penicillin-binding protein 2
VLPVGAPGERNVTLARSGSSWRVAGVQGPPESGTAHLWLQGPASDGKRTQALHAGAFRATRDGIAFRAADASGRKLGSWLFWKDRFKAGASVSLAEAERMKLWFDKSEDVETEITAATAAQAALVGPAWVRGEWTGAFDPDRRIPWVRYLADAVRTEYRRLGRSEADRRYGSISLDAELQTAAQDFVAKKARALHHHRVAGRRRAHLRLPPRAALAVIRIPGGETLALGGWPRMNSSASWRQDASTGEWIPPVTWIESSAPASIRAHFGSDRNFARMLMGSATKPLWASVVLGIHPQLDRKLAVRGAGGVETEVFGIPITAKEWQVQGSRNIRDGANWCDFHSYLAASDNRYQVRLGFLGLAEAGVDGLPAAYEGTVSPSYAESLDGGKNPWRRYPRFAVQCKFNHKNSNLIGGLAETAVADRWARVFASGVRAGDMQYRSSFWSGDEADDRRIAGAEVEGPTSGLDVISPEAPSLALDKVSHPRQYISLLLGGSTNMWSNVDFAGAFGTLVTGRPIVPHITGAAVRPATTRITSEKEAARIRPGLTAVISHPSGTAYGAFRGVLPSLRRLGEVYGKTGTLRMSDNAEATVRMVVAIVRWSADRKQVRDGLVFSLVVERGGTGTAAEWLADFMAEQEPVLRRLMK